jgi:hypothetical protein
MPNLNDIVEDEISRLRVASEVFTFARQKLEFSGK